LLLTLSAFANWVPPLLPPVTQKQIASWLAGGLTPQQIAFEIQTRGINFAPDHALDALMSDTIDADVRKAIQAGQLKGDPLELSPEDTLSINNLLAAYDAIQGKEFLKAERSLREALSRAPGDADVIFAVGNLARQQEQWGRAAAAYERAVKLNPTFPYAHGFLSLVDYRLGDAQNAVTEGRYLVLDRPGDASGYKYMGLAYEASNEWDKSLENYQKALQLKPDYADVYYDMGIVYNDMERWDSAVAAYEKSIQLDPGRGFAYFGLGAALDGRGDLEGSINAYQKAKALMPNDLPTRQNLGHEFCKAGRHQEAVDEFQQLLAIAPDWNMARICLYKSLLALGRTDEAKQVLQEYSRREAGEPRQP
jgi:tetratricopeptide (TPR) repeat protein